MRDVNQHWIAPCRAFEFGCDVVLSATLGFQEAAVDVSVKAIQRATTRVTALTGRVSFHWTNTVGLLTELGAI